MNILSFKKTLFRILLIGSAFIALPTQVAAFFLPSFPEHWPFTVHSIPGFITTQGITTPVLSDTSVSQIEGKMSGSYIGASADFIAIKLSYNSFLAQANLGIYKKGVFFEIDDSDGKIKATAARYCLLTECQNRNLVLTDKQIGDIATSQTASGYGIFDLKIFILTPNIAHGEPTTQSGTYPDGISSSSNAVDGSTNGVVVDNSVSSTLKEQGAWWQVDLGTDQLIQEIRIFNRTDGGKGWLSNYQIIILDSAKKVVYQQTFQAYPDPKQVVDLDMQIVEGRYVKIQLLGNNHLSLAEVQVFSYF